MGKLIKNILLGAGQVLVISPDDEYVFPSSKGFKEDADRLREDARTVTRSIRTKALSYDKSFDYR